MLIFCLLGVYIFYNMGSSPKISALNAPQPPQNGLAKDTPASDKDNKHDLLSLSKQHDNSKDLAENDKSIDVMITFTKAKDNRNLRAKFETTVKSLFHFSTVHVNLHILGDHESETIARDILGQVADPAKYVVCIHLLMSSS